MLSYTMNMVHWKQEHHGFRKTPLDEFNHKREKKNAFDREGNKNLRPKPVMRNPSQLQGKLSALPVSHFEFQAYLHSEQEEVTNMTLAFKQRR